MMLNDDMSWSYSYMSSVGCWRPGREEAEIMSYTGPNLEAVAISSLTLGPYHKILGHYPPHSHTCYLTTHTTVTLGMVLKHDCEQHKVESSGGSSVHIAFVPLRGMRDMSPQWDKYYSGSGLGKLAGVLALWRTRRKCYLMPSSWRRYNLLDMFTSGASGSMQCNIRCQFSCNCSELWLGSLQIESHHYQASFPSQGWLFICPDTQLRSGPCSFQWPDCAAYWSRDPFGAQRLSTEEAEEAGFPLIELELIALGKSWGAGAYAGLWKFHEGKGFAPDSQEIARHLGHPLYQLCDELGGEAPLAHVTGEEPEANQHPPETLSATSRGEAQTVHFDLGGENKTSRSIHAVSTGFNYAFKLPTSILVLVVLCCLFHTAE
ncbi:hypothetical protein C8R47DRAFT_106718 [Mycena vitilis]|nr:hypothetical protein C8R47DRAFT_106718 [Mycena vitilis]